ncbi:MAG: trypsin-like serine protease [Bradymonadia bacterium]
MQHATYTPITIGFSVVFLGLVLVLGCADTSLSHHRVQHAIRNGSASPTVIDAPWLDRAIVWFHSNRMPEDVLCSGLFLTPRVVLTAGHCLESTDNLMVSHQVDGNRSTYAIRFSQLHPQLDLGLAALHRPANIPIDNYLTLTDTPSLDMLITQQVEVAGYGETYEADQAVQLRYGALNVVKVTDSEIEVDGFGERGLCFGDSGAPAFMAPADHPISPIAIATHGDSTCLDKDYLTRIDAALEWILTALLDAAPIKSTNPNALKRRNALSFKALHAA